MGGCFLQVDTCSSLAITKPTITSLTCPSPIGLLQPLKRISAAGTVSQGGCMKSAQDCAEQQKLSAHITPSHSLTDIWSQIMSSPEKDIGCLFTYIEIELCQISIIQQHFLYCHMKRHRFVCAMCVTLQLQCPEDLCQSSTKPPLIIYIQCKSSVPTGQQCVHCMQLQQEKSYMLYTKVLSHQRPAIIICLFINCNHKYSFTLIKCVANVRDIVCICVHLTKGEAGFQKRSLFLECTNKNKSSLNRQS